MLVIVDLIDNYSIEKEKWMSSFGLPVGKKYSNCLLARLILP